MTNNVRKLIAVTAATMMLGTGLIGCSKAADDAAAAAGESDLTVAGGFAAASALQSMSGGQRRQSLADSTLVCAMAVPPFTSGYTSVDLLNGGDFSITIAGAAGEPFGCMVFNSGKMIAAFEFTSTETSMAGGNQAAGDFPVNSGASTITFPSDLAISSGKIQIPITEVVQAGSSSSSSDGVDLSTIDLTGTWDLSEACASEPDPTTGNIVTQCMSAVQAQSKGVKTMEGGGIPSSVYLHQISATDGTNTRFGLGVWASSTAAEGCGSGGVVYEGAILDSGWSAVGGNWAQAFDFSSSTIPNLASTGGVDSALANATIAYTNTDGTTVCNKTATVGQTCAAIDFSGGGWGMSENACQLYCVMQALGSGGGDESYYNFGSSSTCRPRYRMDWSKSMELQDDKDWNSNNGAQAGDLSDGACTTSVDGQCGLTDGSKILYLDTNGPGDRFMFGELFRSGGFGTVFQSESTNATFWDSGSNAQISCRINRDEKMTIIAVTEDQVKVKVESSQYVASDSVDYAACLEHSDVQQWTSGGGAKSFGFTATRQ